MKKNIFVFLGLFLAFASVFANEIQVVVDDYPPYNYEEDGKVKGFVVDIAEAMFKDIGLNPIEEKIQLLPWKRAYEMALSDKNILIFTFTRTESREKLFKWVGAVAPRHLFMYYLSIRKDIQIKNLEDAKKHVIGLVDGESVNDFLISEGFKVGQNLQIVPYQELNFRKLLSENIDLIIELEPILAFRAKKHGIDRKLFEKAYLVDGKLEYFMAFSLKTEDELVNQFRDSFIKLTKNGTFELLKKKYF